MIPVISSRKLKTQIVFFFQDFIIKKEDFLNCPSVHQRIHLISQSFRAFLSIPGFLTQTRTVLSRIVRQTGLNP